MSYRYSTFGHPGLILAGVLVFFLVCVSTAFVVLAVMML